METVEAEVIETKSVILRPLTHIEDGVDLDTLIERAKVIPKVVLGTPTTEADFKNTKSLHLEFVGARTKIERVRKSLKQPALDYGRELDKKAKELAGKIAPYEDALFLERRVWEDEESRAAQEKLDIENDRIAKIAKNFSVLRTYPLNAIGKSHKELLTIYEEAVIDIPEEDLFGDRIDEAMGAYKDSMSKLMGMIENAEKVEAAEKMIAESEAKAKIKADAEAKSLREERESLDRERREFEDQKRAADEVVKKQKAVEDAAALEEQQKADAVIRDKKMEIAQKQAVAEALNDIELLLSVGDAGNVLNQIIKGNVRHVVWRV